VAAGRINDDLSYENGTNVPFLGYFPLVKRRERRGHGLNNYIEAKAKCNVN
jgi:hypothetical protein